MAFTDCACKSDTPLRYLVEVDISRTNTQWINIGAGVWYCNFANTYAYVDASLLSDEYTVQEFGDIGSVTVDDTGYIHALSIANVGEVAGSFYYTNGTIYIHTSENDSPYMHKITLGITLGFANRSFTPSGSNTHFQGRIAQAPKISRSRDPLFWGRIKYDIGGVSVINSDGAYDGFADDYDVYGNSARVLVGYDGLSYQDYRNVFSGTVEKFGYNYDEASFSIADKRKILTIKTGGAFENYNAVQFIIDLLNVNYGYEYSDGTYDIDEVNAAIAVSPLITYNSLEYGLDLVPLIDIIEQVCSSVRGIFFVKPDGRFSFRFIDPSADPTIIIPYSDIINRIDYKYDPSEVISTVEVGYAKNWSTGAYTYYTDNTREAAIYSKYNVYKTQKFDTLLTTLAAAQAFASSVLDYCEDVHATFDLEIPMKYFGIEIGDIIFLEHGRRANQTKPCEKCEVLSVSYNLEKLSITIGVRKYEDQLFYRALTDGAVRITTDTYTRGVIG